MSKKDRPSTKSRNAEVRPRNEVKKSLNSKK